MKSDKRLDKKDLLLYAVTDRHWLNGRTLYEVVKESREGGATFIQLREKEMDTEHFLEEAKEIKKLCEELKLIIPVEGAGKGKYRFLQ